ncbi:hypothetical protein PIB30_021348 [Stylosanthes scabra]|uniref:Uncharacterized protein n=1 Tax=Stylosanthes scabra TaxID=79078 RepID=A0ABU6R9A1_9FABA|nr:hypothetical protein [Stylosanthes scabra]
MAAVFPWDRGAGRTGDGTQWQAEASDEDRAGCTKKGRGVCQRRKVENHTVPGGGGRHTTGCLLGGAVQWRNPPFSEFENGKKDGTTITIPQTSDGRRDPGMVVVALAEARWKPEVGG